MNLEMRDIVLASGNAGKIREFQDYLAGAGFNVLPQSAFNNIDTISETGSTFVENAILKARHAAHLTGLPAMADDSGLVVSALNGEPGIYSARYAGEKSNSSLNIQKLLANLAHVPDEKREAFFYCVIVFMQNEQDPIPLICEGQWAGKILSAPRGSGGFGYDPVFYDLQEQKSAAELSMQRKNTISHRAKALRVLIEKLKKK